MLIVYAYQEYFSMDFDLAVEVSSCEGITDVCGRCAYYDKKYGATHYIDCRSSTFDRSRTAFINLRGCLVIQNTAELLEKNCYIYITSKDTLIDMKYETISYKSWRIKLYPLDPDGYLQITMAIDNFTHSVVYERNSDKRHMEHQRHTCNYIDVLEKDLETTFIYYQMWLNITHPLYDVIEINKNNTLALSTGQLGHLLLKRCQYCTSVVTYRVMVIPNKEPEPGVSCTGYVTMHKQSTCTSRDMETWTFIQHNQTIRGGLQDIISHEVRYAPHITAQLKFELYQSFDLVYHSELHRREPCDIHLHYRLTYTDTYQYSDFSCVYQVSRLCFAV